MNRVYQNGLNSFTSSILAGKGYHVPCGSSKEGMAPRDRISVDVSDMREELEACRTDVAWRELSLAGKIPTLLRERLDQMKGEKGKPNSRTD